MPEFAHLYGYTPEEFRALTMRDFTLLNEYRLRLMEAQKAR